MFCNPLFSSPQEVMVVRKQRVVKVPLGFIASGTARAGWHGCKMVKSYPSILQHNFRLAKDTVLRSAPSGNFCCKVIVGEHVPTA